MKDLTEIESDETAPYDDSPLGPSRRTVLAAERTWLAWFRTGIGVATAAIGVGGIIPRLVEGSVWLYVLLGAGFALLAVAVFVEGWYRQKQIYAALASDGDVPTGISAITALSIAGGVLALATLIVIIIEM